MAAGCAKIDNERVYVCKYKHIYTYACMSVRYKFFVIYYTPAQAALIRTKRAISL